MQLQTHPKVWSPTAFAERFAEELVRHLEAGQSVLELGVGTGVLSILSARRGAEVSALDINPDAIALADENWAAQDLPIRPDRFRHSDRFSALQDDERFDLIFSNPPVLPAIGEPDTGTRDDFEVAGDHGRLVLDAMITESGRWLAPNGRMLTIATSLQGWRESEARLNAHWHEWEVVRDVQLALTDECGPAYIAWWQAQTEADGQRRVYQQEGNPTWWHDVWFLLAKRPKANAPDAPCL
ncbi:MAG: methyltransferase [Myxococcota bacterium]